MRLSILFCFALSAQAGTLSVSHLRCQYLENPLGIDQLHPRLSWIVSSGERGQRQTAFRLLVASTPAKLNANQGDLWDTGKRQTDETTIRYAGKALTSDHDYYWKVMAWDKDGQSSEWSPIAHWSEGLLEESDWRGRWIGANADEDPRNAVLGYEAEPSRDPIGPKWVAVDLGKEFRIDQIVLHPAIRLTGRFTPGYGFPVRFKIETSLQSDFKTAQTIADETNADYPNPQYASRSFPANRVRARYVRVVATKLWDNGNPWKNGVGSDVPYRFALAELQVFSNGSNVALHAAVLAKDSHEGGGWGIAYLTDGLNLYDPHATHAGDAAVLLRKTFSNESRVRRATAYISGLGYYELFLNGRKVGDRLLDPSFTDYTKRVYYTTYDVTSQIKHGLNSIGVRLGNGWFHLPTADLFGFEKAPWTAPPQLLFDLVIESADGRKRTISSDATWKWSTGECTYNSVRGGVTQDARLAKPGWPNPEYSDTAWNPVKVISAPAGRLVAMEEQPVRAVEFIKPVAIREPKPGVYLYDMGVNMTGWVQFRASGKSGQKITLQFNEKLNPDGTLDAYNQARHHTYGRFQTDELILGGKGVDVLEPHFTLHSFQYIQITGLTRRPKLADLIGEWIHTDIRQTGTFECSNEKLNKIQNAILRTQLNYVFGHPIDPLREKMGWTQDVWNDFGVGVFNFDIGPVYRKWFYDFLDAQDGDGHEPPIAPTSGWGRAKPNGEPGDYSDVWWGGAMVYLPWFWYEMYGDTSLMEQGLASAERYLDYIGRTSNDYLIDWGDGDWGDTPGGAFPVYTPRRQTTTAGYYYLAEIVSREAALLGKSKEAARYQSLAEHIKEAFNRQFLNPGSGEYSTNSQTSEAMPLYLALVPEDKRSLVLDRLVEDVHKANDHLRTGFMGLLPLMQVLSQTGHASLAYKIATQEDIPGWWSMIKDGETTVSEFWDPHVGTGNLLNLAGPAGLWYYEAIGGIRPDPSAPGFKKIIIEPQVVGDLTWAKARFESIHGEIRSEWRLQNGQLYLDISIPANTTATVIIPSSDSESIRESGEIPGRGNGVRFLHRENGRTYYSVQSGDYHFVSKF